MANHELQKALKDKATELKRQEAYRMYMHYWSLPEICKQLGIEMAALMSLVYTNNGQSGWAEERKRVAREIQEATVQQLAETKKAKLANFMRLSIDMLEGYAQRRLSEMEAEPLTTIEATQISNMLANIDKLVRLDAGESTDIIEEHRTITIDDLKKAVEKDYFIEVKPIKKEETVINDPFAK